jgi:hypothetical protein
MNSLKRETSPDCYTYSCELIDESSNSASNTPIRQANHFKRKKLEPLSEQLHEEQERNAKKSNSFHDYNFHNKPAILDDLPSAFKSTFDEKSLLNPIFQSNFFNLIFVFEFSNLILIINNRREISKGCL